MASATTSKKKRGRKLKPHVAADGTTINGLPRRPSDGRWRVIATGFTFTEPDEAKAISRFQSLSGTGHAFLTPAENERMRERFDQMERDAKGREQAPYLWVAKNLRERPEYAAKMMEMPKIAYYNDLEPPAAVPTFAELEKVWTDHFKKGSEQKRRVLQAWKDFKDTARSPG